MERFKNEDIKKKAELWFMVFGDSYSKFKTGGFKDDRNLFVNVFEQVIQMLAVADKVYGENIHLDVAINHSYREDYDLLENIKTRFEEIESAK